MYRRKCDHDGALHGIKRGIKREEREIMTRDLMKPVKSGKVREIFDLGEHYLFVASDRISAFDFVLGSEIPDKGKVLNQISAFWFNQTKDLVPNHVIEADFTRFPGDLQRCPHLEGRSMIVRKAEILPVECIVRGYLVGSGYKEYMRQGSVCGIGLPEGLSPFLHRPQKLRVDMTKISHLMRWSI